MNTMDEQQLLREIITLCHQYGVLVHHCYDSRKCTGPGIPDLLLIGKRSILFAELKDAYGQLTSNQTEWRYRVLAAGAHWTVWRPKDLDHAECVIREL